MLSTNQLSIDFSGRVLFKDVSLNLLAKNRYAVVGSNGSGKSTLLKLLAEDEAPSEGSISKPKSATLGILRQDHFRYESYQVIDVVIEGKPQLAKAFADKNALLEKEDFSEADCYHLAELEEIINRLHGYEAKAKAEKILAGLGLSQEAIAGPLSALSGGYKLRVLLAQALFQDPDILLLDEPTNHLDIVSIAWLESFLTQTYRGLLIFISHDREFINRTVTHILDVDYQTITCYTGNYDKFLVDKAEVRMQKESDLAHKQAKIADMQEFVDRFKAKASKAKQAQARIRMIEKIDLPELQDSSRNQIAFNFPQIRESGKVVMEVKKLAQAFDDNIIFDNLSFMVNRGQKLGIIGPNGVGKSTLLKTVINELEPFSGDVKISETVYLGYFAQDFHDQLIAELSLMQWLALQVPKATDMEIRKVLGAMRFTGDDVHKLIGVLSGGECARLIFAKLMLEKPNVLILDEPTNHLDLETIEGLVEGCKAYPGTLLFVSHNRYFLTEVATQLLVMMPNKAQIYPGNFNEYLTSGTENNLFS